MGDPGRARHEWSTRQDPGARNGYAVSMRRVFWRADDDAPSFDYFKELYDTRIPPSSPTPLVGNLDKGGHDATIFY